MIHSRLKEVVLGVMGTDTEHEHLKNDLWEIEETVDAIANQENMKLSTVLEKARERLEIKSGEVFISKIWKEIEDGLKKHLKSTGLSK